MKPLNNFPSPPLPKQGIDSVDIGRLLAVFRRRFTLLALIVAVAVGIATYIGSSAIPIYRAKASIVVDQRKKQLVRDQEGVLADLPDDSSFIDTEVEIARSRTLAETVVRDLNLERDSEFNPQMWKPGLLAQLHDWAFGSEGATQYKSALNHERIVDVVMSNLNVNRVGATRVITLSYDSSDASKAAKIANAFAEAFLASEFDVKVSATKSLNDSLGPRLEQVQHEMEAAERAVEQYRTSHNLLSTQGATLAEQEVSGLDQQLALARAQQAAAEARLGTAQAQLERGSSGDDVGEALNSPVIQDLRRQIAVASQNVAQMETRYGDRYPDLIKARGQLADAQKLVNKEIGRIISNLQAAAEVARKHTESIFESVAGLQKVLARNNEASVKLSQLQSAASSARAQYTALLDRHSQTSSEQGVDVPDLRLVTAASPPTSPDRPKKALILTLGLVIGTLCAFGTVFLVEAVDSGFATADDVEQKTGLPYLGFTPELLSIRRPRKGRAKRTPAMSIVKQPFSAFSESFRNLRVKLSSSPAGKPVKVVVISSALPGEGKTTTALCLAHILGLSGAKSVVVDCDLRYRGVSREFFNDAPEGLVEVINGAANLEDVLIRDERSGATVLPLSQSANTAKDIFGSPAMREILATLRQRYDLVILDTPPILAISDALVLARQADAVILVAKWRKTPAKALEAAIRALSSVDAALSGVLLTKVDMRQQRKYGYGDAGYYHKAYQSYYTVTKPTPSPSRSMRS
jgi:succinoglycan biosynthesis transport protein ExoP